MSDCEGKYKLHVPVKHVEIFESRRDDVNVQFRMLYNRKFKI
jgi:hypothetical protein